MDVKNFKNRRLMTTNMFMVKEVVLPKENDDNLSIYGEYTLSDVGIFKEGDVITTIYFTDTKSLEEIKQLTEYKIKPKERIDKKK